MTDVRYVTQEEFDALRADVDALRELLKVAKCPNCDGSGTTICGDQCQWCDERAAMIRP